MASRRHGGTHLINPICKRLSGHNCRSADKARQLFVPTGPLVVFLRDPRNIFISRFRWDLKRSHHSTAPLVGFGYDQLLAERLHSVTHPNLRDPPEFWHTVGMGYGLAYWGYWLRMPVPKIISRFEVLANAKTGPEEAKRLRDYFQTDADYEAVFHSLYKVSPTYNAQPTDWREWFGPRMTDAFNMHGGRELLTLMGYEE